MKNLTLALFILFNSIIAQAQTKWINYKIDNKLSVKFPSQPTRMSDDILLSSNKDSTAVFTITVIDVAQIAKIDSAGLAKAQENPDFIKGMANFMNDKSHYAKLEDFKTSKWNGFTTYTTMGLGSDPRNKYYHVLMIFIGTKLYMFGAILTATANTKVKDDYFSSISLN